MEKKKIGLVLATLIGIVLVVALGTLVQEGFGHVLPGSRLRWARDSWESGQRVQAVQQLADGTYGALLCSVRDRMAQPHIDKVEALETRGQLESALEQCIGAVDILGGCDDEGMLSLRCADLEMKLQGWVP